MAEGRKSRERRPYTATVHFVLLVSVSNARLCCRDQVLLFVATRPSGLDFSLHQAVEVAQTFPSVALEVVQQLHVSSNSCQLGNHRLHSIELGKHVHVTRRFIRSPQALACFD